MMDVGTIYDQCPRGIGLSIQCLRSVVGENLEVRVVEVLDTDFVEVAYVVVVVEPDL